MDYRIKNILRAMFIFLIIYIVLAFVLCCKANAQNVQKHGKTFVEVQDSSSANIAKGTAVESGYTFVDKNGNSYPIYLSSNGKAFIIKVSQKSGKKYRKYLPKITEQLCGKKDKLSR